MIVSEPRPMLPAILQCQGIGVHSDPFVAQADDVSIAIQAVNLFYEAKLLEEDCHSKPPQAVLPGKDGPLRRLRHSHRLTVEMMASGLTTLEASFDAMMLLATRETNHGSLSAMMNNSAARPARIPSSAIRRIAC